MKRLTMQKKILGPILTILRGKFSNFYSFKVYLLMCVIEVVPDQIERVNVILSSKTKVIS